MKPGPVTTAGWLARLNGLFGHGLVVSLAVIALTGLIAAGALIVFLHSAAPTTITLASGPPGSSFARYAERYRKILAREGVTLKVVASEGSIDNLHRLTDPRGSVDVGFVLSGEGKGTGVDELVSLGSVSYQPLMVLYAGKPRALLSEFKGQRIDIGDVGSGTHALALDLLQVNGVSPGDGTTLVETADRDPARDLLAGRVDAVFVMGDSTASSVIRDLLHQPNIHLLSFTQAEAYARRFNYLNRLELPRGALDFGLDIPAQDVNLIGPTVELVARQSLHPALSDLLLEAAREAHSGPGMFKKRGEFPAPLEHEFRISPDATRYYASGKSFLYRTFPFWIASLIARALAALVPLALLLIPALKIAPAVYRWRMESRIYRWYRDLLLLERDAFGSELDAGRRSALLLQLDRIESAVNQIVVPASFGDLFYGLRGHIGFVRERLQAPANELPLPRQPQESAP